MGKKIKAPNGREMDMGIYGELSKAGLDALAKMMAETQPRPKKKAVRKEKK